MPERFAISAGTIVTMTGPPVTNSAVIVSRGLIESIVPREKVPAHLLLEEYPRGILMPAFVNAHTHLVYTSFRGVADDAEFFKWLTGSVIPLGLDRRDREALESAREGVRQCFRHGITAVGDNHYLPWARQAMTEASMKGVVFYEVFGTLSLNLTRSIRTHRAQIEKLAQQSTGRIRTGIAPHAPYSVPPAMAAMVREVSERLGLPLSIHVSEKRAETDFFLRGQGPLAVVRRFVRFPPPSLDRTPLVYLHENGLLRSGTLLIHAVHLSDSDLRIVKQTGCVLVTCPTSSAKLACGIARASAWLDHGIPVCIATDSPMSGESYDMFEEMRRFVLFQRALTEEADRFPAETVLKMTTVNPAKALGMADMVGDLRQGSCADFIVVEPDRSHTSPNRDIYQTILWGTAAHDIRAVWADGQKVYWK